ncbi:phosphoribosylaminoimidazolesuccinocarboxamide synthase, partial [Bacillus subtilis]|uniref:phosphoribosylaminoimidazolesuccinocarboxamide synthase n=1 Tax=Bacillus subtilis TaxID=1423 RepID=UPI0025766295
GEEVERIKCIRKRVNEEVERILGDCDVRLIDLKVELGLDGEGEVVLADEIRRARCGLWDKETKEKVDKDLLRG